MCPLARAEIVYEGADSKSKGCLAYGLGPKTKDRQGSEARDATIIGPLARKFSSQSELEDCGLSRYAHSAHSASRHSLRSLRFAPFTPFALLRSVRFAPLALSAHSALLRSLVRSAPLRSLVRFAPLRLLRSLCSLRFAPFAPLGSTIFEFRLARPKIFRANGPMIVASLASEPCRSFVFGPRPYAKHPFDSESAPS